MNPWAKYQELAHLSDEQREETLALIADAFNERGIDYHGPETPAWLLFLARFFCAGFRLAPSLLARAERTSTQTQSSKTAAILTAQNVQFTTAELRQHAIERCIEETFACEVDRAVSALSPVPAPELLHAAGYVRFRVESTTSDRHDYVVDGLPVKASIATPIAFSPLSTITKFFLAIFRLRSREAREASALAIERLRRRAHPEIQRKIRLMFGHSHTDDIPSGRILDMFRDCYLAESYRVWFRHAVMYATLHKSVRANLDAPLDAQVAKRFMTAISFRLL